MEYCFPWRQMQSMSYMKKWNTLGHGSCDPFVTEPYLSIERLWMAIVFANVELPQPGAAQAAA